MIKASKRFKFSYLLVILGLHPNFFFKTEDWLSGEFKMFIDKNKSKFNKIFSDIQVIGVLFVLLESAHVKVAHKKLL